MASITINLDETVLTRVRQDAAVRGVAVEVLVSEVLAQYIDGPAKGLLQIFARAEQERWTANGPFLTDDEMYSR